MNQLIALLLSVPGILVATTIHEFSRAAVSTALGDRLPRINKRFTLNPFNHFEPIGFILMIVTGFGWGKPVATSASGYKDRKKGSLLTAILPTVINFLIAPLFLFLYAEFLGTNFYLAQMFRFMFQYNLFIAIYNLIPVSPMDCSKVLSITLPADKRIKFIQSEKFVQMIFLLLLFFGVIGSIINPLVNLSMGFWMSVVL